MGLTTVLAAGLLKHSILCHREGKERKLGGERDGEEKDKHRLREHRLKEEIYFNVISVKNKERNEYFYLTRMH